MTAVPGATPDATFAPAGVWFGGDYNPEQWDAATLAQDEELMRHAGVDTATVGVFAWSSLEPREGEYRFDWLDRTLDRLHAAGVRVVLATPTASPPPWFGLAHPDALPVTADGTRLSHGSRDTYCAAAPAYRQAAARIAEALAVRYAGHPALAMWHVHNEYHARCHCDHAAAAFRDWLRHRHGDDLDALNTAWHTAFWSQGYGDWSEILPPRATQYLANPAHRLDFTRFWSDQLLGAFREQRDLLRRHSPGIPVTTNLMIPDTWQHLDLWRWAAELDVVAVDHYPGATGWAGRPELAFGADLARSLGAGRPWLLMETATSVVYRYREGLYQAKEPGQLRADGLGYLARGSDSVMFFQWRAGRGGSELHHAAMVPHAGPDTPTFREVTALGADLSRLAEVTGSTVRARVALLWDAEAWWAVEGAGLPSNRLRYTETLAEVHEALWHAGVVCDFASPTGDLGGYAAVLAPSAYLLSQEAVANLRGFVAGGGQLLLGCFSGVVDEHHLVRLGGWPGGLTDVVGVRVTEVRPLADDERCPLTDGTAGRLWSEELTLGGAEVLAGYRDGTLAGRPAVTRHRHDGGGGAWYLSTRLDRDGLSRLLGQILAAAGVGPEHPGAPAGVEAVRRHAADGRSWLFLSNLGPDGCAVPARGLELLSGEPVAGSVWLAPGDVAVIREPVAAQTAAVQGQE